MQTVLNIALWATAVLAPLAAAHPGHSVAAEAAERAAFMKRATTVNLQAKCGKSLAARGYTQRARARRMALAEEWRAKEGITKRSYLKARDIDDVLAKNHHSNLTGITFDTPGDSLFSDNSSCLLQAETTEGPYYVAGELVRNDMIDGQEGVKTLLDVQFIDVNTCEPVPEMYVEFWSCNSTGVYSGVLANGNGNSADTSVLNSTALRGIASTDSEGVVQMTTLFPGHYRGRTNHIHLLTHPLDVTLLPNNTLQHNATNATASHVGQLFFDQDLVYDVEKNEPYASNTQDWTTNEQDGILAQEAETTDPMMEYVYVGDSSADGIVAWITVGIDGDFSRVVNAAANYGANGGQANAGGNGGGPGGPPPSGTGRPPRPTTTSAA